MLRAPLKPILPRLYGYNTFTVNADAEAQYEPVTGVDGLFPLTLDCDCVDDDQIETPGGGGGGGDAHTHAHADGGS